MASSRHAALPNRGKFYNSNFVLARIACEMAANVSRQDWLGLAKKVLMTPYWSMYLKAICTSPFQGLHLHFCRHQHSLLASPSLFPAFLPRCCMICFVVQWTRLRGQEIIVVLQLLSLSHRQLGLLRRSSDGCYLTFVRARHCQSSGRGLLQGLSGAPQNVRGKSAQLIVRQQCTQPSLPALQVRCLIL